MQDEVWIALSDDKRLRARAARLTNSAREGARRHGLGRLAATALGRGLGAAAVFPNDEGKLSLVSLQLTGGGPLGALHVETRHPGRLRGYVKRPAAEPKGTLAYARQGAGLGLLPGGTLSVVKQDGHGGYTVGQVALINGEVDDDVQGYFSQSEQVETRLYADALLDDEGAVSAAFASLVQVVPPGDGSDLEGAARPSPGDDLWAILAKAFGGRPFEVLGKVPLSWSCECSLERVRSGLMLLDPEELTHMIEQDKGAEVTCGFCAERYLLDEAGLGELLQVRLLGGGGGAA
jgi:molecular chaperone Hsp33